MDYQTAIDYIHSLPHLHETNDLSYVKRVLSAFDNPQDKVKLIHVTGTNGKGTTCYYLTQLLVNSGFQVATFSSPYVRRFNERIQLNAMPVSDEIIASLTQQVKTKVAEIQQEDPVFFLVEFEFLVVMHFLFCAQQNVDYGVVEVGIGGQHDKTNVFTPVLSVITNIGMDHAKLIGPTLTDIAREKAGVIKSHCPVVLGELTNDVRPIILNHAQKLQAPVYELGRDFKVFDVQSINLLQLQFSWQGKNNIFRNLKINTMSQTQVIDLAIALAAYQILLPNKLDETLVKQVLSLPSLPARMQVISVEPLVIIDGAHNEPAIANLIDNLRGLKDKYRIIVLYAGMVDKQRQAILDLLQDFADKLIITTTAEKRTAKKSDYIGINSNGDFIEPWQAALETALAMLDKQSMLLICGSLHFAGDILELMEK